MNLTARIFIGYFAIAAIGAFFLFQLSMNELKPIVRQSTEDSLVETATLLAAIVREDVASGQMENSALRKGFDETRRRALQAKIWGTEKTTANERVYVTDRKGIVLFDSDQKDVGKDYSNWRDVALTLRGEYGARSTRSDPNDERSTVMHVAAPVRDDGKIIGVLTVAKPNATAQPFLERGRRKLVVGGALLLLGSLAFGLLFSVWLTDSLRSLAAYARSASEGKRVELPSTSGELRELALALETMRTKLEGKDYVESYVQTLTHELKGPLTAVLGAAELLGEEMSSANRTRFVTNIQGEARRMQRVVDRMLELTALETRQGLRDVETIDLRELLGHVTTAREADIAGKKLETRLSVEGDAFAQGERFLLEQALLNLLDNAIGFSKERGSLEFSVKRRGDAMEISLRDTGEGIPEYAKDRLFERFYSLPRPATEKKGTGIGLNFVLEVAELHHGSVTVKAHPEGGTLATLRIPTRVAAASPPVS